MYLKVLWYFFYIFKSNQIIVLIIRNIIFISLYGNHVIKGPDSSNDSDHNQTWEVTGKSHIDNDEGIVLTLQGYLKTLVIVKPYVSWVCHATILRLIYQW